MEKTIKKKWLGDIALTKDLVLLLLIGGLYSLSIALSNTFVNVFLWKQTGDFFQLGLYNFMIAITQPIMFILAGRIAKKVDRIIVLRIGVFILALYYSVVVMSGANAANYLLVLGALIGAGYGFYWLAYNVLTFEITDPHNRDFFNGFLGVLNSLGGIFAPLFAAFMISKFIGFSGYILIFSISLGCFAVCAVLSFFMKRRPAKGHYFFVQILKERRNNPDWRRITNAHLFQGLREGIFAFVINVYVYISTGSEMALGTFAFLNSTVSFISYYLASRFIKKKDRKKAIFLGGLFLFLSIFIIVYKVTYPFFLLYSVIIAISYPMVLVPFLSMTYDVIGQAREAGELRIEYVVVRELFLNVGRILSVSLFLFVVSFFPGEGTLSLLLIFLGAGYLAIYTCIRHIQIHEHASL